MVSWRSLLSLLLLAAGAAGAVESNRIVLRVNDRIATLREYESRREERLGMILHDPGLGESERRQLVEEVGRATMKEINDRFMYAQAGLEAVKELERVTLEARRKKTPYEEVNEK